MPATRRAKQAESAAKAKRSKSQITTAKEEADDDIVSTKKGKGAGGKPVALRKASQAPKPDPTPVKKAGPKSSTATKKAPSKSTAKKSAPKKKKPAKKPKRRRYGGDSDESSESEDESDQSSGFAPSAEPSSSSGGSDEYSRSSSPSSAKEDDLSVAPSLGSEDDEPPRRGKKAGKATGRRLQRGGNSLPPGSNIGEVKIGKSMTETQVLDYERGSEEEEENGPRANQSIAWRNMNSVVESNKEGPWFTQKEHIMDSQERRPDHPDYDPSTIHIP